MLRSCYFSLMQRRIFPLTSSIKNLSKCKKGNNDNGDQKTELKNVNKIETNSDCMQKTEQANAAMSRFVIYDCDIGSDDAWGLMMLIKAEEAYVKLNTMTDATKENQYKILALTCVRGNSGLENVTNNTLRVLDCLDRKDIPIYKGCDRPILPNMFVDEELYHGVDGFGDLEHAPIENTAQLQQEHAVNAMYRFACQYPKMIDFILVGPLTNFAMCIGMFGDDFLDKVRNVYIMGGNYKGKGNITKSAEFNFMLDPEASYIVLENMKKPLVILPWETCLDGQGLTMNWRFEELGAVKSKIMDLMNRAEKSILLPKGFTEWIVCDAILIAAYLFPHLLIKKSELFHTTTEIKGRFTRGQMVLDHLRQKDDNAEVIMIIDKEHYKCIIEWTAGVKGSSMEQHLK